MKSLRGWVGLPMLGLLGLFVLERASADEPCNCGEIIIQGNIYTKDHVLLGRLAIYPGQEVRDGDLKKAESNLLQTGLFADDPLPTVKILEGSGDFKSILVSIKETRRSWAFAVECATIRSLAGDPDGFATLHYLLSH